LKTNASLVSDKIYNAFDISFTERRDKWYNKMYIVLTVNGPRLFSCDKYKHVHYFHDFMTEDLLPVYLNCC